MRLGMLPNAQTSLTQQEVVMALFFALALDFRARTLQGSSFD